uniref:Uncharacterized protein n=1 Tax=Rhizophora mucronata TaxID=61149 RepID=A0A2P2QSF5_RHIMU
MLKFKSTLLSFERRAETWSIGWMTSQVSLWLYLSLIPPQIW